jgi:hypothetical protein
VVICRDQSRLGRDAIEVTLVVRDLVRERGCRLFYYVTGNEVQFANAIDAATTFIQGTDGQHAEWAMGWSQDKTDSALRAIIACANRLMSVAWYTELDVEVKKFTWRRR